MNETVWNTKTSGLGPPKIDYDTKIDKTENKITDHDHSKYITTYEFNKLTAEKSKERLKTS